MIRRHYHDSREFLVEDVERYEGSWGNSVEALQNHPLHSLGSQFHEAISYFARTVAGGFEKRRIKRALAIADGIGVANFMFATHVGKAFSVLLPETSFEITGQSTTAHTDVETWLKAYFCAVIARDTAGIRILCAVPEEVHLRANLRPDAAGRAIVRVFKGLHDPDAPIGQLLIEAMDASQPDRLSDDRYEYVDHILFPLLTILRCILSSDQAEFNEVLEEAVHSHRAFWGSEKNMYESIGWISLPLLAVSVIAFNTKGFEMTFETEYVPVWLARGEF